MKDVIAAFLYLVLAVVTFPFHLMFYVGRYFLETIYISQIYLEGRSQEYEAAKRRGEV